ncbi:MAG: tetratricopeptide repeat protein [Bacteroidales bacterium]|jgi:tetratricopeptide (TPR) repeat protein|nr:tetratricopeptide repeat protein [Bacteroidales bacterium]
MNDKQKQAEEYFNLGNVYYDKGEYDNAIDAYKKTIALKPEDAAAYNNLGNAFDNKGEYDNAIDAFKKAIALKPETAETYYNLGNAYDNKGEYDNAIDAFKKSIALKPETAVVYYNLGNVYRNKGKYDNAIEAYKKAIALSPEDAVAYNNFGNAYYDKDEYDNAIDAYKKAIELEPDYAAAYYNLGNTYTKKGKYDNAFEAYKKAIALSPEDATAYNNLGYTYINKGKYDNAIDACKKAIELKPDFAKAYYNLIALGQKTKNRYIETIASILSNNKKHFKIDIVNIMSQYKDIDTLIEKLLDIDYDDYFSQTLTKYNKNEKESEEYAACKKIYLSSINIMQLLHVSRNEETAYGFAHYTHKDTAEKLLIKKKADEEISHFRLNSILTSNDPTEGMIAFDYLGIENEETNRAYQAFIACFTFDPECLNQFRLYGKEQGQEATGVSIVFRKDFFADEPIAMAPEYAMSMRDDKDMPVKTKKTPEEKYPLYRCIYIDPATKMIIALGHRDDYTFFREEPTANKETIQRKINDYKDDVNQNLKDVQREFEHLKVLIEINENKIEKQLVCDLLLNLRYLVKHVAFKEEQECRIVKVEALANHDKIKLEDDKMFIETQAIGKFIDKIYFAPNAADMEFFQEKMVYNGDGSKHIKCYRCNHPIRIVR